MNGNVVQLPTQANAETAWSRYQALLVELQNSEALQRDMDFNMRVIRAWADFRDAVLAASGRG